ncbi:hypothetical protein [Arsenophonus symbiont of Ornithomya chloropus]|uniref:hypothetical protein n=1 Tax=Arsenophonus symbiont of Ornithomya chloropus TaxID=634121 RepID=UPI0032B1F45B
MFKFVNAAGNYEAYVYFFLIFFVLGGFPNADKFGDIGVNFLVNIAKACTKGMEDHGTKSKLYLPNLSRLGLGKVVEKSSNIFLVRIEYSTNIIS